MFWPTQVFNIQTKKFTKSATNTKMENDGDIMITHQGGSLVMTSKLPIPGMRSEFIKTIHGQEGYCVYIRYDIKNKQPTFTELQVKVFNN